MTEPTDTSIPQGVRRVVLGSRGARVSVEVGAPPTLGPGEVLVRTAYSVVSAGTERTKLALSDKSLLAKGLARPDLVREVLQKMRQEGPSAAIGAVRRRLAEPSTLGYSSAGVVLAVGARVGDIEPGDRVAAGGGGYAIHADVVSVPKNLVTQVPTGVPLDAAAFATIGSVAMHAFRLSGASVGETVAVVGLGLVGLLAGGVAKAAGCRVVGIDLRAEAVDRALRAGFHSATLEDGEADAVLVCAASRSAGPLEIAGTLARDRARVVVVGDVPVQPPRDLYYAKELELVVSRSYGPGRYDRTYEEAGNDYPIGYVRWTERRNMAAFLDLLVAGGLDVLSLVTHTFPLDRASTAYEVIQTTPGAVVLFEYGESSVRQAAPDRVPRPSGREGPIRVGMIGAGSFAQRILIPAIRAAGGELVSLSPARGRAPDVRPAPRIAESPESLIGDPDVDAVIVATRHDSHARYAAAALEAGKAVFVEKPLALSREELSMVAESWQRSGLPAVVGFNRRYAAMAIRLRDALRDRTQPALISIRVDAGALPDDHWTKDLESGGGRILGELCHFVDLAGFVIGGRATAVHAASARHRVAPQAAEDVVVTLRFGDGSAASILYAARGDSAGGKERIEAFADGTTYVIDDWRRFSVASRGRVRSQRARVDKGHSAELAAFLRAVRDGCPDEEFISSVRSTEATIAVVESLSLGMPVEL